MGTSRAEAMAPSSPGSAPHINDLTATGTRPETPQAVWGLCPGCGHWQVCVADSTTAGHPDLLSDPQVLGLVDEAFREHARRECPGLAELMANRGMAARPAGRLVPHHVEERG